MENNERMSRIHRYLQGKMDDRERKVFEEEMQQHTSLHEEVQLEKKLLAGIELTGDEKLRASVKQAEENLKKKGFFENKPISNMKTSSNGLSVRKLIYIAAAAAVLTGIVWWSFLKQEPVSQVNTSEIFAQHFDPKQDEAGEIAMSLGSLGFADTVKTPQDTLREALLLYENGQYDEAAATLDSLLVNHPSNDTALFYLGMSHLNASRYGKAIKELSSVSVMENSPFQLTSKWYLGLSYLMVDNGLGEAKELFAELSDNPEYPDRQGAAGLLRMIENE